MTTIFLIRHAEAEGNLYRRAQGHYNGLITDKGYLQIDALRNRFAGVKLDAVYSSDLCRAVTTAKALYEPHDLPLFTSEDLREVNMGVWEGLPWGYSSYYEPEMRGYFNTDPIKWKIEGSEPYDLVQKRMKNRICDIAKRHDGHTVAIVSHGFAIRALVCDLNGVNSSDVSSVPYCENTAVTLLEYELSSGLIIKYYGNTDHLDAEIGTLSKQAWWTEKQHRTSDEIRFEYFSKERDSNLQDMIINEYGMIPSCEDLFTAMQADMPVGVVGLNYSHTDKSAAVITILFTDIALRRQTVGVQLLGQAVMRARELGCNKLHVSVKADSPAMHFCQKYGFYFKEKTDISLALMEKHI